MTTRNTPGASGYVVGWVASVFIFAPLFSLALLASSGTFAPSELLGMATFLPLVGFLAGFYSFPMLLTLVPVLHFCLRRVPSQAVHVVMFALVIGAATAAVVWAMAWDVAPLAAGTAAVAAGAGRAVVSRPIWRVPGGHVLDWEHRPTA